MMQEDSNQPFYNPNATRRYEPPQQEFIENVQVPEPDYYTASSVSGQNLLEKPIHTPGDRVKNWPPCYPLVHHNINVDIPNEKKVFVRKAYVAWWFHSFCLFWNYCCIMGGIILGEVSVGAFFLSIASAIIGPPVAFCVYFLLYRAMRTGSAFFFVLWFTFYVGQLAAEVFYAIGISSYGAAGFMLMVYSFSDSKLVLGILGAVATFMWIGIFVFNLWIFYQARREFKSLGGAKAAGKEFAKTSVQTAYDNRGAVKQVIVDNKDTIKQVAIENKDAIIDFAKTHKDDIIDFASENKEVVTRVAMENPDLMWENRDAISSVFDGHSK
jgi:hypothetical protein